jgi:hypothetical protein
MKKQITLLFVALLLSSLVSAQTTFNIPVKTSHTVGSGDYDTTINVNVGNIVKLINWGSANVFGYSDNLNLTPVLTSSIATMATIHQWTISSVSYTHVDAIQSPSGSYGRRVYLNVSAGIDDNNTVLLYSIYPCPATDNIIIEFPAYQSNLENLVSIYDLQGQILFQQPIQQAKEEINISNLAKGLYLIKISNNDGVTVKKFIKE